MRAQAPRRLQVEMGSNHQLAILASEVSYGEVLRALARVFDWEIEIPNSAYALKISYVLIKSTQPQIALAELLKGTKLGYSFLGASNGSHLKIYVIPIAQSEQGSSNDTKPRSSVTAADVITQTSPAPESQTPDATTIKPDAGRSPAGPGAMLTKSLSEAVNAIGVPPGVLPSGVGRTNTLAISDASGIIGAASSMSPASVGTAITFPISDAARIVGFPPFVSSIDVGKTITAPLPTGRGQRP
jgi:hypothetical protein